jgi:predicted RNA binding protein YcfA (HicA-like mRNA interferase family)
MTDLLVLKAEALVSALKKKGFVAVRQKGSHLRMKHRDGRVTSVPVHQGQDIGRGLLRKILRDVELTAEELLKG